MTTTGSDTQTFVAGSDIRVSKVRTTDATVTVGEHARVLAEDVLSSIDVPSHDNSAMDGYAFRGSDLGSGDVTLVIAGKAYAGHPYQGEVKPGECIRIMTGTVIPRGCDTVIPQELAKDASPAARA